jgi:hypothetical protein
MNFNKWLNKTSLGVVSLEYDLDRCWRASRKAAKHEIKQKVLCILRRLNRGNINDLPKDRIKEIEKL